MDELIGKTVAQYTLQRKIGQGSIATVFEAQAAGEKYPVAVKVFSGRDPDATVDTKRRFRQLAEKLIHLNHPNILAVTQFGIEADTPFLVMPLVEGGQTLRDRLRQGALGRWRTIELLKQVAGALDYAHQRGVLHLDLKPSNVLVDPQNWSWVSDFGLADVIQRGQLDKRSAYLAPEQVLGEQVDQRSDIYALGVVMYEMLAGTLPYSAAPVANQLTVSPQAFNPNISESLAHVALRAVALKPADRYSSAIDFLEALQFAADDDSYREPYVDGLGDVLSTTVHSPGDAQLLTGDTSVQTLLAPVHKPTSPAETQIPVIIPLPKSTTTGWQDAEEESIPAGTEPTSVPAVGSSPAGPSLEEVKDERAPADPEGEILSLAASEMTAAEAKSPSSADDIQSEETGSPDASRDETTVPSTDESSVAPLIAPVAVAPAINTEPSEEEALPTPTSQAGTTTALAETETPPSAGKETRKTAPNWPVPVWVTVLGLGFVLVLIVWAIFALTLSDSFSSVGATETAAAGAVALPTATDTPVMPSPTATVEPSSTPLPPTRTPLPPSPTATLPPIETPLPPTETLLPPTETPLVPPPAPSATPPEEITPTPETPVGQWSLVSPAEGDPATNGLVQFEWAWTGERLADQGFEIKVWRPGQPPLGAHDAVSDNQNGLIKQTGENSYSVELDISNALGVQGVTSRYLWTVALIQISPEYVELGEQAEPGTLEYLGFRGPEDVVDNSTKPVDNTPTSPQGSPENRTEAPVDNGDNSQPDAN